MRRDHALAVSAGVTAGLSVATVVLAASAGFLGLGPQRHTRSTEPVDQGSAGHSVSRTSAGDPRPVVTVITVTAPVPSSSAAGAAGPQPSGTNVPAVDGGSRVATSEDTRPTVPGPTASVPQTSSAVGTSTTVGTTTSGAAKP